jgi:hypothetical protein
MQQDDPGDSVLALSPSFHSPLKQRNAWSDLCLVIADAIRLHVNAATPEQAANAAQEALQRLEDAGVKLPGR